MHCKSSSGQHSTSIADTVWSISIFLIFFVNSLQQQISGNLLAYVTSSFNEHPLTATTNVVSGLVSGVIQLPVAKLMDIFGRIYGFMLMVFCTVIGLLCRRP